MQEHTTRSQLSLQPLKSLALLILLATLSINLLSAWIRHAESGLGCEDWPACYGQIGEAAASASQPVIAQRALAPDPLAKRAHRLIATVLVVLVLLLLHRSQQRTDLRGLEAQLPLLMAALLLLLAVIGPASYLKTRPAIAACNLLGGTALAALGWRFWLGLQAAPRMAVTLRTRRVNRAALLLLLLQLGLGAWTSANFAGLGCSGLLECAPGSDSATKGSWFGAFWYFRELGLDAAGRVIATGETVTIHLTHRIGACLAAPALIIGAVLALRNGAPAHLAVPVLALVTAQVALGLLAVTGSLPLLIVLGHGVTATLLLLASVRLDHALQPAGQRSPRA